MAVHPIIPGDAKHTRLGSHHHGIAGLKTVEIVGIHRQPFVLLSLAPRAHEKPSCAAHDSRHIVAADRVKAGVFYLYNYLKGLYRSEDGGSTWALVHKGEIGAWTGYNAKLRSAPGKAGQLYFTAGPQSGVKPAASPFMRSNDGGATWRPVPTVLEVMAFGFGKAAKASGDPAIFIVGWVDKTYGLWRSDDGAASWTKIGDYPLGSLDEIRTVEGDKDTFGKVYIGFGGSGFAYGALK